MFDDPVLATAHIVLISGILLGVGFWYWLGKLNKELQAQINAEKALDDTVPIEA